jgi:hypothetical protein
VDLHGDSDLKFSPRGFPAVTAFAAFNSTAAASPGSLATSGLSRRYLAFSKDGKVGVSTGHRRSVSSMGAAIEAARVRAEVMPAHLKDTANLASPMFDVLAWNTVFTTVLHVYTPVSRTFGGSQGDDGATTFVWDVFFAAVMFGLAGPGHDRARDIAYANVITTVYSRTVTGMVPNYRSGDGGVVCTYDRTEPMVGTWSLQILHSVYGDVWIVQLLFPPLLGWNDWVHRRRSAEGSLGVGMAGGQTALVSLGSDATNPPGLNTPHTVAAARYESGLDNSPQYDGNDGPGGHEGFGVGPVRFNGSTSHMELYDVAFTAYHALDGQALVALSKVSGFNDTRRLIDLRTRARATEIALHRDLFDATTGQYANRLYNGTFYHRWAPTIFSPMLLNSTPTERIDSMLGMMGDPNTFCVQARPETTHEGANGELQSFLWRSSAPGGGYMRAGQSTTCASLACLQSTVSGLLLQTVQPVQTVF